MIRPWTLRWFAMVAWVLTLLLAHAGAGAADYARNFGGTIAASVNFTSTATDSAGNVYVAGSFSAPSLDLGAVVLPRIGIQDAFVARLDASGNAVWARNFGGRSTNAVGQSLAVDRDGRVYLGGHFYGADLTTPALVRIGSQDAFVLVLDATGATVWARNFGGRGAQVFGQALAVDGGGNVFLGGYFQNADLSAPALARIGSADAFTLKLDMTGAIVWARNFGGHTSFGLSTFTYGQALAVDGNGNVYLGGYYLNGNLTIPALARRGAQDAFAIKLDPDGATVWGQSFGGRNPRTGAASAAYVQALAVDAGGKVYVGGYFSSADLTTPALTRIGYADAFVLKLDGSGATLWARSFGGTGAVAVGQALAVDDGGNLYLGGYFQGADLTIPALARIGGADAFALKLDSTGATIWARSFGGNGASASGRSLAVDAGGDAYVVGQFHGADFTTPALPLIGSSDAFAIKLDALGAIDWGRGFGFAGLSPGGNASISSPVFDATGNMYVAGTFDGTTFELGGVTLKRTGMTDAYVAKLDTNGSAIWARNFGGSSAYASAGSPAVDSVGNVYLGGTFHSADLTTPALSRIGSTDTFVLKLDATGAQIWARNFGGTGAHTYGGSLAVDDSGNVYVGGDFDGAGLTTPALVSIGNSDAFVFKLDGNGTTLWARNFGGTGTSARGPALAVDRAGGVVLGGYYLFGSLNTPPLGRIGDTDGFVVRLDAAGTVSWAGNFGGDRAAAWVDALAVDQAGNLYLGGSFEGANLTMPALAAIGLSDAFVLKLHENGTMNWARNFGGSGASVHGYSLALDGNANVYLGGTFHAASLTQPALTLAGDTDAFAVKLSATGTSSWVRSFGGSGAYTYGAVAADSNNNVYVAGAFSNANLTHPPLTRIGDTDAFILREFTLPTVTGIEPSQGPHSGGTLVTIRGTKLTGTMSVKIGSLYATGVNVIDDTTITATTAGGWGLQDVVVTTPDGTGTGVGLFTYFSEPSVFDIVPARGPSSGGTPAIIHGVNFTGASKVVIGGATASGIAVLSDSAIKVTTPAGIAGARDVTVISPGGSSTGPGVFTYIDRMLDIDDNGHCDALTDGLLVLRYLFGISGLPLINDTVGPQASRDTVQLIVGYLNTIRPALDIDGNGQPDALTDGLLVLRYLFGVRGDALIAGAVGPQAKRATAASIEPYLESLAGPR